MYGLISHLLATIYINDAEHKNLKTDQEEVGKLLGDIIKNPQKYM
jgi:hypothetical protein